MRSAKSQRQLDVGFKHSLPTPKLPQALTVPFASQLGSQEEVVEDKDDDKGSIDSENMAPKIDNTAKTQDGEVVVNNTDRSLVDDFHDNFVPNMEPTEARGLLSLSNNEGYDDDDDLGEILVKLEKAIKRRRRAEGLSL